jgi:hypothetical protein
MKTALELAHLFSCAEKNGKDGYEVLYNAGRNDGIKEGLEMARLHILAQRDMSGSTWFASSYADAIQRLIDAQD